MFLKLIKLQWLKAVRSASFGRKLTIGVITGIIGIIALLAILAFGIELKTILLQLSSNKQDIVSILNRFVIYYFLAEVFYRYFLQKTSSIELESFLHLPVSRPKIIHFLLGRSLFSPFNIIAILLFTPFCKMVIVPRFGLAAGLSWLFTLIVLSWGIHYLMLLFKQKFAGRALVTYGFLGIIWALFILTSYSWLNLGQWAGTFFSASLNVPFPLIIVIVFCLTLYLSAFNYYRRHAYLQELGQSKQGGHLSTYGVGIFKRMGRAGASANLELKLILRHKKSRQTLIISALFMLIGLLFYTSSDFSLSNATPLIIYIGIAMTGVFIMNYGRFFLSWNSSDFDFYLARERGIEALVRGKYLIFTGVSLLAWIITIPYVYFGWQILLIQTAAFLFNIGINIHLVIYASLWKPKPMSLGRGVAFNYEGLGAAQIIAGIVMVISPYCVYLVISTLVNYMAGIIAVGAIGILGIIFSNQLINWHVKRIIRKRYSISSSFRQET